MPVHESIEALQAALGDNVSPHALQQRLQAVISHSEADFGTLRECSFTHNFSKFLPDRIKLVDLAAFSGDITALRTLKKEGFFASAHLAHIIGYAALGGHTGALAWMKAQDFLLMTPNEKGETALTQAVHAGHATVIRWLIETEKLELTDPSNPAPLMPFVVLLTKQYCEALASKAKAAADQRQVIEKIDQQLQRCIYTFFCLVKALGASLDSSEALLTADLKELYRLQLQRVKIGQPSRRYRVLLTRIGWHQAALLAASSRPLPGTSLYASFQPAIQWLTSPPGIRWLRSLPPAQQPLIYDHLFSQISKTRPWNLNTSSAKQVLFNFFKTAERLLMSEAGTGARLTGAAASASSASLIPARQLPFLQYMFEQFFICFNAESHLILPTLQEQLGILLEEFSSETAAHRILSPFRFQLENLGAFIEAEMLACKFQRIVNEVLGAEYKITITATEPDAIKIETPDSAAHNCFKKWAETTASLHEGFLCGAELIEGASRPIYQLSFMIPSPLATLITTETEENLKKTLTQYYVECAIYRLRTNIDNYLEGSIESLGTGGKLFRAGVESLHQMLRELQALIIPDNIEIDIAVILRDDNSLLTTLIEAHGRVLDDAEAATLLEDDTIVRTSREARRDPLRKLQQSLQALDGIVISIQEAANPRSAAADGLLISPPRIRRGARDSSEPIRSGSVTTPLRP